MSYNNPSKSPYDPQPYYGVSSCIMQPIFEQTSTTSLLAVGERPPPHHNHTIEHTRKWCITHRCEIMPNDLSGHCQMSQLEQRLADVGNRLVHIENRLKDALQVVQVMEKLDNAYEKGTNGSSYGQTNQAP